MRYNFKRYCKDYQNIENYEAAKKDNFKGWECHHRLETHTSDGERRLVDITKKELIALGMYYNRPAEELIFLTVKEHSVFKKGKPTWNKGKKMSAEYCRKNSESHKGKNTWSKGKPKSEETRRRMSGSKKGRYTGENNSFYGKHHSEESKKKMSKANKGRHWYNNGKENRFCFECPEGFVSGKLLINKGY